MQRLSGVRMPNDAASGPVAQRVDHHGHGPRRLTAARIIEVVAGKYRAPVCKHPFEPLLGDVLLHQVLREKRQAASRQRRPKYLAAVVEHPLALDARIELMPIL